MGVATEQCVALLQLSSVPIYKLGVIWAPTCTTVMNRKRRHQ